MPGDREHDVVSKATNTEVNVTMEELNQCLQSTRVTVDNGTGVRDAEHVAKEMELLKRERDLLQRERDILMRERETLRNETGIDTSVNATLQRDIAERLLPDFDPSRTAGLTADRWVQRVEAVAKVYGWSQPMILVHVTSKLKGAAKQWLECAVEEITTWMEFKTRLVYSFPATMDQADVHLLLTKRRKNRGEDYESFIYTMKSMAQRGNIDDSSLIKYILNGLDDREMAKSLSLCELGDVEELLSKIKRYESMRERERLENRHGSGNREKKPPKGDLDTPVTCYNCHEAGHIARKCNKPPKENRSCFICHAEGHLAASCPKKNNENRRNETTSRQERSVKKIEDTATKEEKSDGYNRIAQIDGQKVKAFIDLGSDCVTLRQSTANRLQIKYLPAKFIIRGFGSGSCQTLGKRTLLISLDEIEFEVETLIVPDSAQEEEIIVGRNALDQPGVKIVVENGKLSVTREIPSQIEESGKVMKIRKKIESAKILVNENVKNEERDQLETLIHRYRECFAENIEEVGTVNFTEFKIKLTDDQPVSYKPYRIPYSEREHMKKLTEELLEADIIRPSVSEYASPALLVNKANGEKRMVIDYRKLNDKTKKDKFPMVAMDEVMDQLSGNKYFTVLDMASGYYQLKVAEESRQYTAFVTTEGHYEFTKMPFGLVNAPASFNRVMRTVEKMLRPRDVVIYMDDVLIPSRTVEEGLQKFHRFLEVLKEVGLTLKISKCKFLQEDIQFLGYDINKDGVRPGEKKTEAIKNFRRPENVHEVRQFVGLTSFFRKFVVDYATISRPLTKLTKKGEEFVWKNEQEEAFQKLKVELQRRPTLALYDPAAELQVHTDASKFGLAGLLLQRQGDKPWRPVCYYSRQTTDTEMKYHSFELEALAVVESLERFRIYVLGRKIRVFTDCNSLKTMLSRRDLNPRIARWCLKLMEYDVDIEHRSGEQMKHVDALSRSPNEEPREPEVASLHVMTLRISDEDWLLTMQLQDGKLQEIVSILQNKTDLAEHRQVRTDYVMKNNRLCRKTEKGEKWVVPKVAMWRVIRSSHDDMGHFGEDRTVDHLKKYFWFPKMRKRVKSYIAGCVECAYHKRAGGKKEGELHNIERSTVPFQVVHMDHLGPFPRSKQGNTHVITYQDNFTKYILLRAVKDTKSKATGEFLKDALSIFGSPRILVSDRGTAFTASSFEEICKGNHITHVRNATATPRANGQVERSNATITTAITTGYKEEEGRDWDTRLREIQFAMNAMKNKTTQKSPHELLMAYEPGNILQNHIVLALQENEEITEEELKEKRVEALQKIEEQQGKQKKRFDKSHKKPRKYKVGDLVLIEREFAATGQSRKLTPKYKGPYQVAEELPHDRYRLRDVQGAERTQRSFDSVFATDRMKPWCRLDDAESESSEPEEGPDRGRLEESGRAD